LDAYTFVGASPTSFSANNALTQGNRAAKDMIRRVGWDWDRDMAGLQLSLPALLRIYTNVTTLPDDWHYFGQKGCFELCIQQYAERTHAVFSKDPLPYPKAVHINGNPVGRIPHLPAFVCMLGRSGSLHLVCANSHVMQWCNVVCPCPWSCSAVQHCSS